MSIEQIPLEELITRAHKASATSNWKDAVYLWDLVTKETPLDPDGWFELGSAFSASPDYEKAIQCFEHVLKLRKDHRYALAVLGGVLMNIGRPAEALEKVNRALDIAPNLPVAMWNRALINLTLGNYEEGFEDYEFGYVTGARRLRLPVKKWNSHRTDRLMIVAEQGSGDIFQMARFLPVASRFCDDLILEVRPDMLRLMEAQDLNCTEIAVQPGDWSTSCEFDYWESILGLPRSLWIEGIEVDGKPYLKAPGYKQFGLPEGFKIGLIWKGADVHPLNHERSMAVEHFAPIVQAFPNIQFYSLQKDAEGLPDERVIDLSDQLRDWSDTADLLTQLDLLVCCDTGSAHLAGALGVPVLNILPKVWDWRYGGCVDSTPWYDSMRIVRQDVQGDWESAITKATEEIKQMTSVKELNKTFTTGECPTYITLDELAGMMGMGGK